MIRIKCTFEIKQVLDYYVLLSITHVDKDKPTVLVMNEIAKDILDLIVKGLNEKKIIQELTILYDAPNEVIRAEVAKALEELSKMGIIELT